MAEPSPDTALEELTDEPVPYMQQLIDNLWMAN